MLAVATNLPVVCGLGGAKPQKRGLFFVFHKRVRRNAVYRQIVASFLSCFKNLAASIFAKRKHTFSALPIYLYPIVCLSAIISKKKADLTYIVFPQRVSRSVYFVQPHAHLRQGVLDRKFSSSCMTRFLHHRLSINNIYFPTSDTVVCGMMVPLVS